MRSLKGEGILGAEKEVSIHVVFHGILITLSWEALLTNRALFPWRGGRAPSAGLRQGTHCEATRERQQGKESVSVLLPSSLADLWGRDPFTWTPGFLFLIQHPGCSHLASPSVLIPTTLEALVA